MNDFGRRFKMMNRIFWVIFITAFVFIIGSFILTVVLGYNVLTDPQGVGEWIGKILNGIKSVK